MFLTSRESFTGGRNGDSLSVGREHKSIHTVLGTGQLADQFTRGDVPQVPPLISRPPGRVSYRPVLEKNGNPFAVVVLAHLKAQATHSDPVQRRAWKFRLVKGLYERKLMKQDIRELFRILDWILVLPEQLQQQFREDVHQYEQEKRMPYLSSLERMALEEGLEKGREQGREQGREEGLQAGRDGVALALKTKFGQAGRKLLARIRQINDPGELRRLTKVIDMAKTVDDVRRQLS